MSMMARTNGCSVQCTSICSTGCVRLFFCFFFMGEIFRFVSSMSIDGDFRVRSRNCGSELSMFSLTHVFSEQHCNPGTRSPKCWIELNQKIRIEWRIELNPGNRTNWIEWNRIIESIQITAGIVFKSVKCNHKNVCNALYLQILILLDYSGTE